MTLDPKLAEEAYCYLTTTGRVTGRPHTIEIWFGLEGATLYLLAGGRDRSDWVRNLKRQPRVSVRIRDVTFEGEARTLNDGPEDTRARRMLVEKYEHSSGSDLSEWGDNALAVAVELAGSVS